MDYENYFGEFLNEAEQEMNAFLEATVVNSTHLKENLQVSNVAPVLKKPINRDKIVEFTGRFKDEHNKQLSTAAPVHMFTFADKQTSFLYSLFSTSKEQLVTLFKEGMEKAQQTVPFRIIEEGPHKILIAAMMLEAHEKGYDDIIECCKLLFVFSEYPILYRKFWRIGVKEDVMNYTVEHAGNKFKFRKFMNVLGWARNDLEVAWVRWKDRLDGYDWEYQRFIYDIRTQLVASWRKLAELYYANEKANKTLHVKSGKTDDGHISDQEGYISNIAKISENTFTKISINPISNPHIKISAEYSEIDKGNLTSFLNRIFTDKNNQLRQMIENIITSYLTKNPTESNISAKEFINKGMALYRSIATSKDPLYMNIHRILNYWMYTIIDIKSLYNREQTHIAYRRAIWNYLILMIAHHN